VIIDSEKAYFDYCLLSTWWDNCVASNIIKDNKAFLGDDFLIENIGYSFHITSHGHALFKFIKNGLKPDVNFYIEVACDANQFEIIYESFLAQISESCDELSTNISIKEMMDESNSAALVESLVKKFTTH